MEVKFNAGDRRIRYESKNYTNRRKIKAYG